MEFAINAKVECTDGNTGHVVAILLKPNTDDVTHIVVKYRLHERIVPVEHVTSACHNLVMLNCTCEELEQFPDFVVSEYIMSPEEQFDYLPSGDSFPYIVNRGYLVQHESVPRGELSIERGTPILAKDGHHAGKVDELIVNDDTRHHITHVVLHKGHLWGSRDVVIPVEEISAIKEGGIYLKMDID